MFSIEKKIALGFVIYKAEITLIDRIKLASSAGFKCYIFDNSPSDQTFNISFSSFINCKYITAGKNVGLGFGISSVCAQAYYEGSDALLFFDQDTVFNISTLDFIDDFYRENKALEDTYSSIVFNAKNIDSNKFQNKFKLKDVLLTISSGSLFYLRRLRDINWHNQTYFVDCVDYEFCLNSNNHNLKIGECSNTPGFDHVSEQADSEYLIFGKKRMMRKYNLSRVKGTATASLRLFFTSIITVNPKFAYAILRSLGIYLYFQFLVRILNFFK
ncbi:rhamnosyltransferase [Flavobacterium succinicans]|uniref:Rhamnosyltransferase n=1 Tax=Flavobacterium succinicans TaxID=29536 RepID=A0A1I4SDE4_9FLAO|nr:hypothetical protein [Flavobacterium succinicans]SFM62536.1 rhamnosyltransferase [Flavobacterium succinicans]